jgi:hypothetical protein
MKDNYYAALDYILQELRNREYPATPNQHKDKINEEIIKIYKIHSPEIPFLYRQLAINGYIDIDDKGSDIFLKDINLKGILFIDDGGYIEENRRKTNSANLKSAETWAIAIGTSLSGVYCLFEFLKWLVTHLFLFW